MDITPTTGLALLTLLALFSTWAASRVLGKKVATGMSELEARGSILFMQVMTGGLAVLTLISMVPRH